MVNIRAPNLSMWIVRGTCALMVMLMVVTLYYVTGSVGGERDFPLDDYEGGVAQRMDMSSDEMADPMSAEEEGQGQLSQGAWSKFSFVAKEKAEEDSKDDSFISQSDHPADEENEDQTENEGSEPETDPRMLDGPRRPIGARPSRLEFMRQDSPMGQIAAPSGERSQKLPSALIVGARKAGTRALAKFLNLHPQIVTLGHEVQFFNNLDNFNKGEEWYRSQMPRVNSDQIVIEKTADYFHTMEVPERVYKMNPDMRIIVVLRDPFDRMVSDYVYLKHFAEQYKTSYHFAEEDHTLEDLVINNATGEMMYSHGGLHRSEYHKFIANWLKFFPLEQIVILNGDLFVKENPAKQLQKVEESLGLRPYLRDSLFSFDAENGFYCVEEGGCSSDEKGQEHPSYPVWFEKKVRDYFYYKNRLLYDLTGEDMGWK